MRANRKGNVAIKVALMLVVLLSAAAFGVDLPFAHVVQAELQNVADASSHAAAAQIDGTAAGLTSAIATAKSVAGQNYAGGAPFVLNDADIETGIWDGTTYTVSSDPALVNTIRVQARLPTLGLFFAPVMGTTTVDVGGESYGLRDIAPAGSADCFLPLALPLCLVEQWEKDGLQDVVLRTNPPAVDNVGWALPNGSVNAANAIDQLGDCNQAGTASVGDPVYLMNGTAASVYSELVDQIIDSDTNWRNDWWGTQPSRMTGSAIPSADYGNTLEGIVMVFDGGPGFCDDTSQFNSNYPLVGFAYGGIYDVKTSGGAAARQLNMRLDTSSQRIIQGTPGGIDLGIMAWAPPVMVQPH